MEQANHCLQALKQGKAYGAWQMLPGTNVSRALAYQGFDWILVDCEHGNIDDAAMHEAVQAVAACGSSPIVRIPAAEGWMIKRALDAGAHGVMVPLLTSVEDAETIVQWSNFPPRGKRGWGSPFPMNAFAPTRGKPELSSVQYMQQAHDALLTVVQIETQGALDSVEKIAAVPGIDVLFVGPFDLGNNIGAPILEGEQDQKLKDAIRRVLDAAVAAGKKAGIYCISGEQAKGYIDMGFHMVSAMTDMVALPNAMSQALQAAKGTDGQAAAKGGAYS